MSTGTTLAAFLAMRELNTARAKRYATEPIDLDEASIVEQIEVAAPRRAAGTAPPTPTEATHASDGDAWLDRLDL